MSYRVSSMKTIHVIIYGCMGHMASEIVFTMKILVTISDLNKWNNKNKTANQFDFQNYHLALAI